MSLIKFQAARGEVHRKDKSILGMLHMERKLVWTEAALITLGYFQLNSEPSMIIVYSQQVRRA